MATFTAYATTSGNLTEPSWLTGLSGNEPMGGSDPMEGMVYVQCYNTTSSQGVHFHTWGFIKFDIAGLPSGIIYNSVTLNMYVNNYSFMGANFYQATSNWNYATTWNTKPGTSTYAGTISGANSTWASTAMPSSIIESWRTNNYGLVANDGDAPDGYGYSITLYGNSSSFDAYISIVYSYAPTAPTVTFPNGGESFNQTHTITWNAATDADTAQGSLQYHIQLSTNNGGAWNDIVALTSAGATSYQYNFASQPNSSQCLIRIRAYDGANYGAFDQSNAVFSINHHTHQMIL